MRQVVLQLAVGGVVLFLLGCAPEGASPPPVQTDSSTVSSQPASPSTGDVASMPSAAGTPSTPDAGLEAPAVPETQASVEEGSPGEVQAEPSTAAQSDTDLAQLIEQYDDAVVYITVQDSLGEEVALGSGFVIDGKGLVVTNYHVVAEGSKAYAQLRTGDKFEVAGYCAVDPRRDLVILQLQSPGRELEVFELKDPAELKMGELLVAIGHPEGFRFTATTGIVSAVRHTEELPEAYQQALSAPKDSLWIQTNAAISHGSSGGPLLNRAGQLVGINTWIAAGQNIGFATHVSHLLDLSQKVQDVQSLPIRGSAGARSLSDREVIWMAQQFQTELQAYASKVENSPQTFLSGLFGPKNPTAAFTRKLLELAETHRGERSAFDALVCICRVARYDLEGTKESVHTALDRLRADHSQDPHLGNAALALMTVPTDEALQFQRDVIRNSQHEDVRAYATLALALTLLRVPDLTPSQRAELIGTLEQTADQYGDALLDTSTFREMSENILLQVKHLSLGGIPLPVEGADADGTPLSLAALRGQVVLLDFWVDWCPYCREMYPVERNLLEKYAGRPFTILGVNGDQPERYRQVLEGKTVTWRSIADGPGGPNLTRWQIESFPTVYLIGRRGDIRAFNQREEKILEVMIDVLLDQPCYPLVPDLVSFGSAWRYWDDPLAPPSDWMSPALDDAMWNEGQAPVGYGLFDEATVLKGRAVGEASHRAVYFRRRFSVGEITGIQDLVLALRCDDGAAVFLNGQEIARVNLSAAAAADSWAAAESTYDEGREELLFVVDPQLLKQGDNVLAVALHQAKEGNFDARFDLALGTNVVAHLTQIAAQEGSVERADAVVAVGRLGAVAASARPTLEKLLEGDDLVMRARALEALALIAPETFHEDTLPPVRNDDEAELRKRYAVQLNQHAWSAALPAGLAPTQYEQAQRFLQVACRLAPTEASLINSLGLAELRCGRLDEAIERFTQSQTTKGENAFDTLLLALTYQEKGEVEQSQQLLAKARQLSAKLVGDRQKADFNELLSQVK